MLKAGGIEDEGLMAVAEGEQLEDVLSVVWGRG
jgi:hypothetical protein